MEELQEEDDTAEEMELEGDEEEKLRQFEELSLHFYGKVLKDVAKETLPPSTGSTTSALAPVRPGPTAFLATTVPRLTSLKFADVQAYQQQVQNLLAQGYSVDWAGNIDPLLHIQIVGMLITTIGRDRATK